MEREIEKIRLELAGLFVASVTIAAGMVAGMTGGWAQAPPPAVVQPAQSESIGSSPLESFELSPDCQYAGKASAQVVALPNIAKAIKLRNTVRLLVVGGVAAARQWGGRNSDFFLEHLLEKSFKGLEIEVIDRAVSGELARNVADRLEVEVALNRPDAVLWEAGTIDALVGIPAAEIRETITASVRWLRERHVDVVLIGMQYARRMRTDRNYQRVRAVIRALAKREKVLLVGRYEAEEVLDNARLAQNKLVTSGFDQTENGYNCVAEYTAQAIVAGLIAKRSQRGGRN